MVCITSRFEALLRQLTSVGTKVTSSSCLVTKVTKFFHGVSTSSLGTLSRSTWGFQASVKESRFRINIDVTRYYYLKDLDLER